MRLPVRLTLVAAVAAATLLPAPAEAAPWRGHPDRSIVRHTVRAGETATGLAVRYHAWTAELLRLNHLGPHSTLRRGQVVKIPVVVSAARKARGAKAHHPKKHATTKHPTKKHRAKKHRAKKHHKTRIVHRHTPHTRKWLHADMSRKQVRRLITRVARRYHVPPRLALAIAWQESGWQQRRVSSTGALGVMQVMPDTGRWMRWYVGRPLRLRDTHDNVLAGVMTIRVLRSWTRYDDSAIAAYYQGLGAVREHGWYDDTKHYVAAVKAHRHRLARTGRPV